MGLGGQNCPQKIGHHLCMFPYKNDYEKEYEIYLVRQQSNVYRKKYLGITNFVHCNCTNHMLRSGLNNRIRPYCAILCLFTKLRVVLHFSLTLYILSVRVGLGVKCCLLKYPTTHGAKWGHNLYHVAMFVCALRYKRPVRLLSYKNMWCFIGTYYLLTCCCCFDFLVFIFK